MRKRIVAALLMVLLAIASQTSCRSSARLEAGDAEPAPKDGGGESAAGALG